MLWEASCWVYKLPGDFRNHKNRRNRFMREIIGRANQTREWGDFPKPFSQSISGCRFFLDLSRSESQSSTFKLHQGRCSIRSDGWSQRKSQLCDKKFEISASTLRHDLVRAVNRQPWLPPGVTRRAPSIQIYHVLKLKSLFRASFTSFIRMMKS